MNRGNTVLSNEKGLWIIWNCLYTWTIIFPSYIEHYCIFKPVSIRLFVIFQTVALLLVTWTIFKRYLGSRLVWFLNASKCQMFDDNINYFLSKPFAIEISHREKAEIVLSCTKLKLTNRPIYKDPDLNSNELWPEKSVSIYTRNYCIKKYF